MPSSLALLPCKSTGWFFKTIFWLHVLQTSLFKPETGFVGVSPHAAMSAMLTSKKTSGLIPFVFQQPMKIVPWVGTNQSSRSPPLTKRIEALGTRMVWCENKAMRACSCFLSKNTFRWQSLEFQSLHRHFTISFAKYRKLPWVLKCSNKFSRIGRT